MSGGLPLVKAYLDAFMSGRTDELERRISPSFRYRFLPPEFGQGVDQVIRLRAFSFDLYRKWEWTVTDGYESGSKVVVWLHFVGAEPSEPGIPPRFEDSTLLEFEVQDGLIVGCDSMHPTLEGNVEQAPPSSPSAMN